MFKTIEENDIWPAIKTERERVLAYLRSLSPDQWNQQSLCDGWMVRDVVAHLAIEYKYTPSNSVLDILKNGFNVNKFIKNTAIKTGKQPVPVLLEMFRATVQERTVPKTLSPFNALADLLVHEQDIRIALGDTWQMPKEPLRLIFSHWEPSNYNFGEKITGVAGRVKNLSFVAEDLEITVGVGDEVRGSAQNILLAITGRRVALDHLSGSGSKILIDRIS